MTCSDRAVRAPLNPHEQRICALVTNGRSNRSIGDELDISERAVAQHLTKIYRKLGIRGRAELYRDFPAQHDWSGRLKRIGG